MLIASLFLSMSFAMFTQPLTMGLMLMLQTLLTAYIIFHFAKSSWFSFILIIVMAGALLVAFIYVAVLTPVEPHARRSFWSLPVILPPSLFIFLNPYAPLNRLASTLPNPLFYKSTTTITIILASLLLLALLMVVHNTFLLKGPMRSY